MFFNLLAVVVQFEKSSKMEEHVEIDETSPFLKEDDAKRPPMVVNYRKDHMVSDKFFIFYFEPNP